jgi:hypothetical protein
MHQVVGASWLNHLQRVGVDGLVVRRAARAVALLAAGAALVYIVF